MDDILGEFLVEAFDSLESLDALLMTLEGDPVNEDAIKGVFRVLHTLKGTSGFLGLSVLEKLSHSTENILSKVRDKELFLTPEIVQVLFQAVDAIKSDVQGLQETGEESKTDFTSLYATLEKAANNALVDSSSAPDLPETQLDAPTDKVVESTETVVVTDEIPQIEKCEVEVLEDKPKDIVKEPLVEEPKKETSQVAPASAPKPTNQSIRVSVDVLDNLMTIVSELVLTRNQILQMFQTEQDTLFNNTLSRLNQITTNLQEEVMKTRMQPIQVAWAQIPRQVRDNAKALEKKVELTMIGETTELDRQVIELIKDPTMHMIRNSIDHGIELPEERIAKGKNEEGHIILEASHEGGFILISISDDGKGLDSSKIKEKIIEKGMDTKAHLDQMNEEKIFSYIFKPGFSTAEKVSNISGRGVGMDVVRSNIEKIGGSIQMHSILGKGTKFTIKIPITLTIISGLIVEIASQRFSIPQSSVKELVRSGKRSTYKLDYINSMPVLRLRDQLLPLISLGKILGLSDDEDLRNNEKCVVVAQVGNRVLGLVVDKIFDIQEIVLKPLAKILRPNPFFSSSAILGDGKVVMILDTNGLLSLFEENLADMVDDTFGAHASTSSLPQTNEGEEKMMMLIYRIKDSFNAVPMSLVTRIDEIESASIHHVNGIDVIPYRDRLIPIIGCEKGQHLEMPPCEENGNDEHPLSNMVPILIFKDRDRIMALVITEVVDILENILKVDTTTASAGCLGTAIVNGRTLDIADCEYYIKKAYPNWLEKDPLQQDRVTSHRGDLLLVDDSPFFRNLITPILNIAGYHVVTANNGKHALDVCDQYPEFDAIVSDIEMPEMDGYEFAGALKAHPKWKNVPLIALSSKTHASDISKSLDVGFLEHVIKSDQQTLLNVLGRVLPRNDS